MGDYLWGLATLPLGLAALFACWFVVKAGYLALGLLGKAGVAKFGSGDGDYRFRVGAVAASASRVLMLNKGTTGVMFFTGLTHKGLTWGGLSVYESALRSADRKVSEPEWEQP